MIRMPVYSESELITVLPVAEIRFPACPNNYPVVDKAVNCSCRFILHL